MKNILLKMLSTIILYKKNTSDIFWKQICSNTISKTNKYGHGKFEADGPILLHGRHKRKCEILFKISRQIYW